MNDVADSRGQYWNCGDCELRQSFSFMEADTRASQLSSRDNSACAHGQNFDLGERWGIMRRHASRSAGKGDPVTDL